MIVLGIDPGSRRCGYAAVERVGPRLRAREWGVLAPRERPLAERLARILEGLAEVIARTGAGSVSIESAFCGSSPRSALVLGQARGVALAAAARAGLQVFEYSPATVKRAFTGSGRADKGQMVRTARQLLGVEARLADEADAIAVAVCHLASGAALLRAGGALPAPPGADAAARRALERLRPAVRRFPEAR